MRTLRKFRVDLPYILGLIAGFVVIMLLIIDAIVRGANPLVIPIVIGAGVVGTAIGIYITWLIRTKVIDQRNKPTDSN